MNSTFILFFDHTISVVCLPILRIAALYFCLTTPVDQSNSILKERLYEKMEPYLARAEVIKAYLMSQNKTDCPVSNGNKVASSPSASAASVALTPTSSSAQSTNDGVDSKLMEQLAASVITSERPQLCWDDIAGTQVWKK